MAFTGFMVLLVTVHLASTGLVIPKAMTAFYANEGDVNLAYIPWAYYRDPHGLCDDASIRRVSDFAKTEVARYATNQINARKDILPNITIGGIFLPTCNKDLATLSRVIKLTPDTGTTVNTTSEQFGAYDHFKNVIGVVEPFSSRESVMVSSLLGLFQIPQISTGATSDELSDKARFEYFLRLATPDRYRVTALLDTVVALGWNYFSLLYSEGSFGRGAAEKAEYYSKQLEICIGYSKKMPPFATEEDYDNVVEGLWEMRNARAVLLFLQTEDITGFFKALSKKPYKDYFIFLGAHYFNPAAYGLMSSAAFQPSGAPTEPNMDFERYLTTLNPANTAGNPWIKWVWEKGYDCTFNESDVNKTKCDPTAPLPKGVVSNKSLYSAIEAVNVFAIALHNYLSHKCPKVFDDKSKLETCFNGKEYLRWLRNTTFNSATIGKVSFDSEGDRTAYYLIQQYNHNTGSYIQVGEWKQENNTLSLQLNETVWGSRLEEGPYTTLEDGTKLPKSVCSEPCGEKQYIIPRGQHCCWACRYCADNEILLANRTGCDLCPLFTWPDAKTQMTCLPIEPSYMRWTDGMSIALICLACLGVIGSSVVTFFFLKNRKNKLMKASSRELSSLTMTGIITAFLAVISFVARPNKVVCIVRHCLFHLPLTLIYAPLFIKTLRIYRLFNAGERGIIKPPMTGTKSQLILSFILLTIQGVLCAVTGAIATPDGILRMQIRLERKVELFCDNKLFVLVTPLAYNIALTLCCAFFGFLTRKLPENFNESWYIFICVCTTSFLWIIFLPTYFTQFYAYNQAALIAFALFINGFVVLLCLYVPKIYAVYFIDKSKIKVAPFTRSFPAASTSLGSQNTGTDKKATSVEIDVNNTTEQSLNISSLKVISVTNEGSET